MTRSPQRSVPSTTARPVKGPCRSPVAPSSSNRHRMRSGHSTRTKRSVSSSQPPVRLKATGSAWGWLSSCPPRSTNASALTCRAPPSRGAVKDRSTIPRCMQDSCGAWNPVRLPLQNCRVVRCVDRNVCAAQEKASLGGREEHDVGELLGLRHAPERQAFRRALERLVLADALALRFRLHAFGNPPGLGQAGIEPYHAHALARVGAGEAGAYAGKGVRVV